MSKSGSRNKFNKTLLRKMDIRWFLLALLSGSLVLSVPVRPEKELNNRPIIAILAQDAPPYYNQSYIAASYVKYLESSGARVVPVPSHYPEEKVEEIFNGVNGVLFPGGGIKWSVSGYYKHAQYFFHKAIEAYDKGDYFPIWGTCLGFQTLHVVAAGDRPSILSKFSASDISLPLEFTNATRNSRMFTGISEEMSKAFQLENITYNHHHYGVSTATYQQENSLKTFFNVLSLNKGLEGKTFISTVEAYNYPIYGTQWHPEKNNFEHNTDEHIPNTFTAIKASQYTANFFVNEARKSQHKFANAKIERDYLIYNYNPVFTGKGEVLPHFEQAYFFNDRD